MDESSPGGSARRSGPLPSESARRTLSTSGVVAALAVGLLFLWYARDVLLLVFAGTLLAVFFRRLATLVTGLTRLPPAATLPLVLLCLTAALVGAFWARGETIAAEGRRLRQELPRAAQELRSRITGYTVGEQLIENVPDPASLVPSDPDAFARITGVVSRTFSGIASAVVILFLGVVLAATPGVYVEGILALFPANRVPRMRQVLLRVGDTLWWWLIGRLIAMTFIGVVTGLGLALLGVPLAFVLGLLAALLSFVPNLGPILAAIPAILLGLLQDQGTALAVVALYAGVQVVETYLLDPILDRKTVYLPPALTITAQLLLALLGGFLGIALATPLAAAAVVAITMLYVQDVLGRTDVPVAAR